MSTPGVQSALTSVGAGAAVSAHRRLVLGFPQRVQVQRTLPDRARRLGGALTRLARRIRRRLHVVFLKAVSIEKMFCRLRYQEPSR